MLMPTVAIVKFSVRRPLLCPETGGPKTPLHPRRAPLNSRLFNTGKA